VFSQFKKDMDKNAKVVATLQKENLSLKKKSAKSDAALIEMVNEVRLSSGPVGSRRDARAACSLAGAGHARCSVHTGASSVRRPWGPMAGCRLGAAPD
jgi:hypothetical protein